MTIEAVVFDVFETLVTEVTDSAPDFAPIAAAELGIALDGFRASWRSWKHRRYTTPVSLPEVLAAICDEHGVKRDPVTAVSSARAAAKAHVLASATERVVTMLDSLRARGVPLAVVSNCATEDCSGWAESPLAKRIDHALFSCFEGVTKPDPEIYRAACRRLAARPGRTLFVGDGNFSELRGASEAGLSPVRATWFSQRWPSEVVARVAAENTGFPIVKEPVEVLGLILSRAY